MSLDLSQVIFDNPSGTTQNFTNLSINDTLDSLSGYMINWTVNSSVLPTDRNSFREKFVNISTLNGTVSIDNIVWHWRDTELTGYDESLFELWKYNSTGWTMLNSTPDVISNELSLTSMDPASDYGILQSNISGCVVINTTGLYGLTGNVVGAPNYVNAPFGVDYACVVIVASDVLFDCNGYSIDQ